MSVSVVIPTYNCAAMLPDAIRSAFAQSRPPDEVVVVNDGSTDETADVLARLAPKFGERLIVEQQANGGEARARNRGVSLATGDLVAFLDQDDEWMPGKLERQIATFEHNPSLALSFTAYTRVSGAAEEEVVIRGWRSDPAAAVETLIMGCCITPSTVVVRRDVLLQVGEFDETLWLGCDWDMWLRIVVAGHRVEYLSEPLTRYAWHETNMSRDRRKIADAAGTIFPRLFSDPALPDEIAGLESTFNARWSLIRAELALEDHDGRAARAHLRAAARHRIGAVRPGWARLYARSFMTGGRR